MNIVNRRNVWFVVIVALAVMLSTWITASAAAPASQTKAWITIHNRVQIISQHNWGTWTGAGQTGQMTYAVLDMNGKRIGTGYWSVTAMPNRTVMAVGETRIFNRGRIELQGVWPWTNTASSGGVIVGGTGVFRGVHGEGYYTDATDTVTLTYR